MSLERFSDVGHFEARVQSFLLEREAVHNLMLGIIGHLHSGTVKDPLMATVERGGRFNSSRSAPPHTHSSSRCPQLRRRSTPSPQP